MLIAFLSACEKTTVNHFLKVKKVKNPEPEPVKERTY
jgi:hypothetical protein